MTTQRPVRTRTERIADARKLLESEVDAWVATASEDGNPAMVPLSFTWDGEELLLAAPAASPAGRNLARSGRARIAVGHTRDVVMIDAVATEKRLEEIPEESWLRYRDHTGWDPRQAGEGYRAYVVVPERMQVWREAEEIAGRTVMRDGGWLQAPE